MVADFPPCARCAAGQTYVERNSTTSPTAAPTQRCVDCGRSLAMTVRVEPQPAPEETGPRNRHERRRAASLRRRKP